MADEPLPKVPYSFRGAIALANWLKRKNYYIEPKGSANVADGNIWPSFKNVVERYCGRTVNRYFFHDIHLVSSSFFNSRKNQFEILIPADAPFNRCLKRFATCKELCHILVEPAQSNATSPITQMSSAIGAVDAVRDRGLHPNRSPLFNSTDLSSESFCLLLALEILIPIRERDTIMQKALRGVSTYDIAYHLLIPELLVIFYIESFYISAWRRNGGAEMLPKNL